MDFDGEEENESLEAHDTLEEPAAASTSGQSGHLLYARSGSGYSGLRAGSAPALSSGPSPSPPPKDGLEAISLCPEELPAPAPAPNAHFQVPATPMHQAPPLSLQQQRAAAGPVAEAQMVHTRAMSALTGAGNEPLSLHWDIHLQKVAHARGSSERFSSADSSIGGTGRYCHGCAWTLGTKGGADLPAGDTAVQLGHLELSESELEGGCAPHEGLGHRQGVFWINDLDTGKFIVDEGARGEEFNWVKDLQTGQEISLKESEQSLGLSPILQEVERRERLRDHGYRSEEQLQQHQSVCQKSNLKEFTSLQLMQVAVVGTYKGRFYGTEGNKFKYVTQIDVRSLRNVASQIRASFSAFGDYYIISGREDEHCYIWSTANAYVPSSMNPVLNSGDLPTTRSRAKFVPAPDRLGVGLPSTRGWFSLVRKAADKHICAEAASQAAFSPGMIVNQVVITAGYDGDIRTLPTSGFRRCCDSGMPAFQC
eukprot:jgi/Chlat1/6588/Chrsp46S06095